MNLKSARRILQFVLPVTLLITSCASGASAAGTADTSAQIPSAETSDAQTTDAEAPSAETSDAEAPAAEAPDEDNSAQTTDEQTSAEQPPTAEAPAAGYTIAADYPNPYEMETYDSVPEYLSERHNDVDYGTIEADVEYYSEIAGDVKYCNVLLPAGYDESKEYPVLYMFHGFGGRYDSHVHEESILQTLYGNMLSEGLAVPMIIVGADMYTGKLEGKDDLSDAELRPLYDKGVDDLALCLMPFIESRYSVKVGRRYAAVSGVSQGGTEALASGFKWQSKIAFIGSFAPSTGVIPTNFYPGSFWNTPILDDLTIESQETLPLYIYLSVGTEDPWCIKSTLYYGQVMDEKGIPNQTDLVEGYDHGNEMWELGHYNFLQKIFLN